FGATQAGADPPKPPHGDGVHPGGGNDHLDNSAHTLHPNPAPPTPPPDTSHSGGGPLTQPSPPSNSGIGGVAGVKTSGHAPDRPHSVAPTGSVIVTPTHNPVVKHRVHHAKVTKALPVPVPTVVAPPAVAPPTGNPQRSSLADRLLSPTDINLSAKNLGEGGMIALLLAALLYLPVTIFNKATEKNHETIRRWFARPRAAIAFLFAWIPFRRHPAITLVLGVIASAVLFSFIEPGFPAEDGALQYLIGMVIGFAVVSFAFFATWRLVLQRLEPEGKGEWKLYPPFIFLAAFLVVMARLAHFLPGVVLGTVAEYEPAKKLSTRTAGIRVATTYGVLMFLGLAAWFAWIPVEHAASKEGASSLTLILDSALAITFVSGLESVAFGLIPMTFLDGNDLFKWHKGLWAAMWGAALLWFSVVILHPAMSTYGQFSGGRVVWFALLFSTLMMLALMTWAFFRLRDARLARASGSAV
ncbi:MAG: hypothetical protein QOD14_1603, partial [Solirubrobacterales bacterium]|nr:hypothetical protein [Solirubrobacterales bacterium]